MPSAWVNSTTSGRLPVGHEPGVGVGLHRGGPEPVGRRGLDVLVGDLEAGAHAVQRGDGGDQAVLGAAVHPHLAAGDQAGHQVAEGLVAVALRAWSRRRVSDSTPSMMNLRPGRQLDPGAHALEEQRQLDDLGLGGRVAQHGAALGQRGGEQHGLGGADARVRQLDAGAAQPGGLGGDAVVGARRSRRPGPRRASMWKSTGRLPIWSPPTSGTNASPMRCSSGPSSRIGMRLRPLNESGHLGGDARRGARR